MIVKAISKNEYTRIAQDFCSFSRRKKGRIASYVTLFTTQKMDKKPSKLGIFFAGNRLTQAEHFRYWIRLLVLSVMAVIRPLVAKTKMITC
jgi:hypothetical protein